MTHQSFSYSFFSNHEFRGRRRHLRDHTSFTSAESISHSSKPSNSNFELALPAFVSENLVQRSMVRVSLQEDCLHGEVVMVMMMMVMWQTAPSVERTMC